MDLTKEQLDELWKWSQKIKKINNSPEKSTAKKKEELLSVCRTDVNSFSGIPFSLPSTEAEKQAKEYFSLSAKKFSFDQLLNCISATLNNSNDSDNNILCTALMLLSDAALYQIYQQLDSETYGGVYYQLNCCIILDSMRFKPRGSAFASLLNETSEKLRIGINGESNDVLWTVAMLNYRTHKYDVAIDFFNKYLSTGKNDPQYNKKRVSALIYIGYCYEKRGALAHDFRGKRENFDSAILHFTNLLSELEEIPENQELRTELHHGLGHFYNERAVFGSTNNRDSTNSDNKTKDILLAREHMRKAVQAKSDYCSCYGSLFREYGDLERALLIFEEASELPEIKNNEEADQEMRFYRGYTKSALSEEHDDSYETAADQEYTAFENYCSNTFNYDGIAHAKLFRIRNALREIELMPEDLSIQRSTLRNIRKWKKTLHDYPLSEYASEVTKKEYEKTRCILDVLATLYSGYSGTSFNWRAQDLFYYLREFVSLMDDDSLRLDYAAKPAERNSPLNRIRFGRLWFWCIGGDDLHDVLIDETDYLESNKIPFEDGTPEYPVDDIEKAHKCIIENGKPDMIIVIPPLSKNAEFEHELSQIKDAITNAGILSSCFLYANRDCSEYSSCSETPLEAADYSDNIERVLQFAYCMRSLEVLKKEILQPIPLFSLAPTHFSVAYDYQLGDESEYMPQLLQNTYSASEDLRGFLQTVDEKFQSLWIGRKKVNKTQTDLSRLCCINDGFFAACFPEPENGPIYQNNYISYKITDISKLGSANAYGNKNDVIYTTKALPNYSSVFYVLAQHIRRHGKACQNVRRGVKCRWEINCNLKGKDDISKKCEELIKSIFGTETNGLNYPYKCILQEEIADGSTKKFIFIILSENKDTLCQEHHPIESNETPDEGNTNNMADKSAINLKDVEEKETPSTPKVPPKNFIRVLHLSDFHYKSTASSSDNASRSLYIRKLKEKLIQICEKETVDYICFTGDVAHSGITEDYDGAKKVIAEIRDLCKVRPNHFLICPGNHDINLRDFFIKHPTNQEEAKKLLSLERIDLISHYFAAFSSFCKDLSCAEYIIDEKPSYLLGVKQFEEDGIAFVCINTAWFSMNDELKSEKPWIGYTFVNTIINQLSNLTPSKVITLMHHPYYEWEENERQTIDGYTNVWADITELSDVILCGHTHEAGSLPETVNNAQIFHGGCLYENKKPNYENCFYVYTIPLNSGSQNISIEKYFYHHGKWSQE